MLQKRAIHNELDRLRLESIPEILTLVSQVLSIVYAFILFYTLYRKQFSNAIMYRLTFALGVAAMSYNISVMIFDWVFVESHWWRLLMLVSGSSSVLLTAMQQLQVLKSFIILSAWLNPNHIFRLQIAYTITVLIAMIGSYTEDILYYHPTMGKFMQIWGTYGRIYQAVTTTVLTNCCSVYMIQIVYKHTISSKKTANNEKEIVFRNYVETIQYTLMQVAIDLLATGIYISTTFMSYKKRNGTIDYPQFRIQYAWERIAASFILIRVLLQGKVFQLIVGIKFYKNSKRASAQVPSQKRSTAVAAISLDPA
jgi:hypothetical protein